MKKFLTSIIKTHFYKGHHYEVAWTLWIARTFKIKISKKIIQKVLASGDSISTMIILDMINAGILSSNLDLTQIRKEINKKSFTTEGWLLAYESIYQNWIQPNPKNLLLKEKYFSELQRNQIHFYDPSRQVTKLKFKTFNSKMEREFLRKHLEEIVVINY